MLFDAYALIALLREEPAAEEVGDLLHRRTISSRVSAANLSEIVDRLVRISGRHPDEVTSSIDLLKVGGLQVEPVSEEIGSAAGMLRAKHHRKASSPVSIADCIAAGTAVQLGASLATSDPALLALCGTEGIRAIGLRDSRGRRVTRGRAGASGS